MASFKTSVKTHQKHHNFHNKGSSLLTFIPEVTTTGTYILCQNVSPVSLILVKLSQNSVLSILLSRPLSSQDHCTSIWVKIKTYSAFLSGTNSPLYMFGPYFNSFQDPSHFKTLVLVYLHHNGYRTAYIPTTYIRLAGRRPPTCIWGVERPNHISPWSIQHRQRMMVCYNRWFPW